jgi:hypothetical protein
MSVLVPRYSHKAICHETPQEGTVLSPLWDRDHPLFDREEFMQERKKIRGKKIMNEQEIEYFTSRQEESLSRKEDRVLEQMQADLEKVLHSVLWSVALETSHMRHLSATLNDRTYFGRPSNLSPAGACQVS